MKLRHKIVIPILSLLVILSLGLVAAATSVRIDQPAAGAEISGSVSIGATIIEFVNATNATAYYRLGAGAWTLIENNQTVYNASWVNFTWDTTAFQDASLAAEDFDINVTVWNTTSRASEDEVDTNEGIDINNGNPTCTYTSATPVDQAFIPSVFNMGTDADLTIGIHNCTLTINSVATDVDAVSDACTFSDQARTTYALTNHRSYTYDITAYDGNGDSTACTTRTAKVQFGGGSGGVTQPTTGISAVIQQPTIKYGLIIVIFIVAIGLLWWVVKKS